MPPNTQLARITRIDTELAPKILIGSLQATFGLSTCSKREVCLLYPKQANAGRCGLDMTHRREIGWRVCRSRRKCGASGTPGSAYTFDLYSTARCVDHWPSAVAAT